MGLTKILDLGFLVKRAPDSHIFEMLKLSHTLSINGNALFLSCYYYLAYIHV